MKKIYFALFAFALSLFANKTLASGGPDAYGYTWTTSLDAGGPAYNWIDITSRSGVQTVSGLADDNSASSMINIGFDFHFYWSDYTQLKVGSNGWLSFNNISNIASCFPTIPSAGGAGDNVLAAFMSDLNFTGAGNPGQVKYWTNNNDSCVVSYINVPFWSVSAPGWTGSNNFQVILCAADSSITFQYGALGTFTNNAACTDMTIGIENTTGSIGLQVHSDAMPPSNYAIKFDYPSVVLLSIQDVLPKWNDNSGNRAIFIPNTVAQDLLSNIGNAGNTAVSTTINLQSTILNSASTTVHSSSGSIPTMAAGDDSTFTFPNAWTPATTGQYTFQSTVTNSQDINAANNTRNTELEAVDICAPSMQLSYVTGNTPNGSVNWNGGANDDGVAVYFLPPVYPYTVSNLQFYISSNVSNNFVAQIMDDDGPNGTAGTILFNQTVNAAAVATSAWNSVAVSTPVTLNDGGFYVVWYQGGTNIFLGSETAGPRSHRNYEILDGGWGEYRDDANKDLCIRATINGYATAPIADFMETTDELDVDFTDISNAFYATYYWDFGDGNSSTEQNPSHTYAAPGVYNVCLTTTGPCASDGECHSVTVCTNPVAAYGTMITGQSIIFTDNTTGTVDSWAWDFGDGNTSTIQSPAHTYSSPGTYNVCLIVFNSCGDSDTICQTISVCGPVLPNFNANSTNLTSNFTDQSVGAVSWSWDFGDGNSSTDQNPSHTYTSEGTYNVCLTATNSCGTSNMTCQTITVCAELTAGFNQTDNGLDLDFTDATTGSGISWFWDFGDGNSSTLQNPSHTYSSTGTYNVCMIVQNMCTADTLCQSVTVCDQPFADFTYIDNNNWTLDFTDQSSAAVSWAWDFGDGGTSNLPSPSHTYTANGDYTVCLTVLNDCGISSTSCQTITVLIWGITENTQLLLNGYPNPTTGMLFIDFTSELNDVQLEVTDVTGKVVLTKEHLSGTGIQVDASTWAAGYYHIRVIHANGVGTMTLIRQ